MSRSSRVATMQDVHWSVKVDVPPAVEPVTVEEQRLWMREGDTSQDDRIAVLIKAARRHAEMFLQRTLIDTTLDLVLDCFPPDKVIRLPFPPISSVTSINYLDADGVSQLLAATEYDVDTNSEPGRVTEAFGKFWPETRSGVPNTVTVKYVAGYGSAGSDVHEDIVTAIQMMAADMYEHREARLEMKVEDNPTVMALLRGQRIQEV